MADGFYPGERSSPFNLNLLADFYRDAAQRAAGSIQPGTPMSAAPMRMLAIHSIELNLSAFLLAHGQTHAELRALGHDVAARVNLASALGLGLRQRTVEHIRDIARNREYLVTRYGPDSLSGLSQITRVLATLVEVATKVSQALIAIDKRKKESCCSSILNDIGPLTKPAAGGCNATAIATNNKTPRAIRLNRSFQM